MYALISGNSFRLRWVFDPIHSLTHSNLHTYLGAISTISFTLHLPEDESVQDPAHRKSWRSECVQEGREGGRVLFTL